MKSSRKKTMLYGLIAGVLLLLNAQLLYAHIWWYSVGTQPVHWEKDKITVNRSAHGLWDLSHILLPTSMPLKNYYRSLLRVYVTAILDIRRANRLTLRTRPPILSYKYLRLWLGSLRILFQFMKAHTHHEPKKLKKAMDKGEIKIKKAENGKYYLPKGTYIIRFNTNVTSKNSKLLIN